MSDHLHHALPTAGFPYYVAVTCDVECELVLADMEQVISRGIYLFTNKEKARSFTTVINRASSETVAYLFTATPQMETENHD